MVFQCWPAVFIETTLGECPVFAGMLTQTGSYCGSSTLLPKQTFSLRQSHMKKRTKYGEIFNIIFIILTFMAISS